MLEYLINKEYQLQHFQVVFVFIIGRGLKIISLINVGIREILQDMILINYIFIHLLLNILNRQILESGYVNIDIYNDILLLKAENYIKSGAIKSLKPHINETYDNNYYGIIENNHNNVILSRVLSVICYCDLTEFSRIWSATFTRN